MNHIVMNIVQRRCLNNSARRDAGYVIFCLPEAWKKSRPISFSAYAAELPRKCNLPQGIALFAVQK